MFITMFIIKSLSMNESRLVINLQVEGTQAAQGIEQPSNSLQILCTLV
jgi:hypothetical protein